MATDEKLDFLLYEMQSMKANMQSMEANVTKDIADLKSDLSYVKQKVTGIEMTLENETNQNIKLLA